MDNRDTSLEIIELLASRLVIHESKTKSNRRLPSCRFLHESLRSKKAGNANMLKTARKNKDITQMKSECSDMEKDKKPIKLETIRLSKILTVQQAAKELGISEITLRRWIFLRKFPVFRNGIRVHVYRDTVEAYINERKR